MLFLYHASNKEWEFTLATEMEEADKFDDVVIKYKKPGDKEYQYFFLQAKHKQYPERDTISKADLLNEADGDFSLQKYFKSFRHINSNPAFQNSGSKEFVLFTNTNLGPDININRDFQKIETSHDILYDLNRGTRYKLNLVLEELTFFKELTPKLNNKVSDAYILANALYDHCKNDKTLTLKTDIFKKYNKALSQAFWHIFSEGSNPLKFSPFFINNDPRLCTFAQALRAKFQPEQIQVLKDKSVKFSKGFFSKECDGSTMSFDKEVEDEEIQDFLKSLTFALNQPNEIELEDIISKEVNILFDLIDSDLIYSYFQKHVLDWMKQKEGYFLSKKDFDSLVDNIKTELAKIILTGPTKEHQAELSPSKIHFSESTWLTDFLEDTGKYTGKYILYYQCPLGTSSLGKLKVYDTLNNNNTLKKPIFLNLKQSYIFEDNLQKMKVRAIVISVAEALSSPESFIIFIQKISEKNKIIIISEEHLLPKQILRNNTAKVLNADLEYDALDDTSKKFLLDRVVTFQGSSAALGELIAGHETEVLESYTLLELIEADNLTIGNPPTQDEPWFIPRQFESNNIMDPNAIANNVTDYFAFEDMPKNSLIQQKVKSFNERNSEQTQEKPRYIALDKEEVESQFKTLCEENPHISLHWLKEEKDNIIWVRTHGNVANLCNYLSKHQTKSNTLEKQSNIIAAEPGMGKSTIVSHIENTLKKENPTIWIIRINLLDSAEKLANLSFDDPANNIEQIINVCLFDTSSFSKRLLQYYISQSNVAFLFDGFDEITPSQQDKAIQLFQVLNKQKPFKLIITTRLHLRAKLENALSTLSHSLIPFSKKQAIGFMVQFWLSSIASGSNNNNLSNDNTSKDRLEKYADNLLLKFSQSTNDNNNSFIGIPLQAKLLAEAFKTEVQTVQFDLPERLNLIDLYDRFIKAKYEIFIESKIKEKLSNALLKPLLKELHKEHQKQSLAFLFPKSTLQKFKDSSMKEELTVVGIIQFGNTQPHFFHRTFAEYYVAHFFITCLHKEEDHPTYKRAKQFLIRNICQSSNKTIYTFIDSIIAKEGKELAKQNWKAIKVCNLTKDQSHRLKLFIFPNQTQKNDLSNYWSITSQEKIEERFKSFFCSFNATKKVINGGIKIDRRTRPFKRIDTECRNLYESALSIHDKSLLNIYLTKLYETSHNQEFINLINSMNKKLLEYIYSSKAKILNHYINVCLNFGDCSMEILNASIIQNNFAELAQLVQNPAIIDFTFFQNLTPEKIVYLFLQPEVHFSSLRIEGLLVSYTKFRENDVYQKLLLKIDPSNLETITLVKQCLIKQISETPPYCSNLPEYTILLNLNKTFSEQDLSIKEAENIIENKFSTWTTHQVIEFIQHFKVLTPTITHSFIKIIKESHMSVDQQQKALNIWEDLISPLLDKDLLSHNNSIDKKSLIRLISSSLEFCNRTYYSSYSSNTSQFKCLIDLIKEALINPTVSAQTLDESIRALVELAKAAHMKLIVTDSSLLLILDDKLSEEIPCVGERTKIIELVKVRILNEDSEEFRLEFRRKCEKVVESLQENSRRQSFNSELDLSAYFSNVTNLNLSKYSKQLVPATQL